MSAVQFAYDYIYRFGEVKQRHPDFRKYRFGRMKPRSKTTISKLYRGLYFETKEQYELFLSSVQNGTWTTNDLTSWTIDYQVAGLFVVTPYVKNKSVGYGGVVIKAVNVQWEQILFDGLLAHWQFRKHHMTFPDDTPYTDEGEIVLQPSTFQVEIYETFNFAKLEKALKESEEKEGK